MSIKNRSPFKSEKIKAGVVRSFEEVLQAFVRNHCSGNIVGITGSRLSKDYSYLDIYLSIYPEVQKVSIFEFIHQSLPSISHKWASTTAKKLRKFPVVRLHLDDTLDQMHEVNQLFDS